MNERMTERAGFTLMEILVVVLIMGILAALAVPQYTKTVENSKASSAAGTASMISSAYRMYIVDHPGWSLDGYMSDTCNTGACNLVAGGGACKLVRCNYVARKDWDRDAYVYTVTAAGSVVAARRTGAKPGTDTSPYTDWSYTFDNNGACTKTSGTPKCPL